MNYETLSLESINDRLTRAAQRYADASNSVAACGNLPHGSVQAIQARRALRRASKDWLSAQTIAQRWHAARGASSVVSARALVGGRVTLACVAGQTEARGALVIAV